MNVTVPLFAAGPGSNLDFATLSVQVPMTGSDLTPWNANTDTLSAAASTPAVTAHRLTFVMLHLLNECRIVKKAVTTPVTTA